MIVKSIKRNSIIEVWSNPATTTEGRISLRTLRSLALALFLLLSFHPQVLASEEDSQRDNASASEPPTQQLPSPTKLEAKTVRVIDGTTVEVSLSDGRRETVRFLQVHVPTGRSCTPKAVDLVKGMVLGKTVQLELDHPKRDGNGRLLAYVYVNGKSVQQALLNEGLARVAPRPADGKYVDQYRVFEDHAKALEKGIWASSACKKEDRAKGSAEGKESGNNDHNPNNTLKQSKSGNSGGRLPKTGTQHPAHALIGAGILLIGLFIYRRTA